MAASRTPAGHPSVRSCTDCSPRSDTLIPVASRSARVSSSEKRRSGARSSASSPASRRRCRPSAGSSRVASTTRSPAGRRVTSISNHASASSEASSCRSSITRSSGSWSRSSSPRSRSTTGAPAKRGVGLTRSTTSSPAAVASASITWSQNRCASRSPRSTVTQATAGSVPAAQARKSTVLPLPAGAQTRLTVPAGTADRRSKRTGRETNRPAGARGCWEVRANPVPLSQKGAVVANHKKFVMTAHPGRRESCGVPSTPTQRILL